MKIVEIFSSIQGEGIQQGRPCTFVRCAGCNLNCSWCDTEYARDPECGEDLTVDEVFERISKEKPTYICITGGEPLLQIEEVTTLSQKLQNNGFSVEIETNGTINFYPLLPYASINMDVKCPSSGEEGSARTDCISRLRENDALMFVVRDREDCTFAQTILSQVQPVCPVFFSPVEGSDRSEIARFICDTNLLVRLQIQLHKQIGVR